MNIDGHFLKKPVNELIQKQEFLAVPLMTGVTDHEVSWILHAELVNSKTEISKMCKSIASKEHCIVVSLELILCLLIVLPGNKLGRGYQS